MQCVLLMGIYIVLNLPPSLSSFSFLFLPSPTLPFLFLSFLFPSLFPHFSLPFPSLLSIPLSPFPTTSPSCAGDLAQAPPTLGVDSVTVLQPLSESADVMQNIVVAFLSSSPGAVFQPCEPCGLWTVEFTQPSVPEAQGRGVDIW